VREHTGADTASLLGHCQGGTLATIYAALHPDEVRNLVLLAAPIDFAPPPPPHALGSWSLWSRQHWYDPRVLAGPGGNVPAHLPGRAVAALSAPAAALPWIGALRNRMAASEDGRAWLAACQWVDDGPPIARAAFVQWLAACYQRNDLVQGRMAIGGDAVRIDRVTASVLSISGRRDVITPPHQVARGGHFPAAGSFSAVAVAAGHVGLIAGPTARAEVHEPMARWLAGRSA
jgi:polyhydroxyalkanoate synthase subunit PhaC